MNSQIFNTECITSKSNSAIVKIAKLLNKKGRKESQLFTLDGVKLFIEAYNFSADIECIVLKDDSYFEDEIIEKIKKKQKDGVRVYCVNQGVFTKLTEENAPQDIITVCKFLKNYQINNFVLSTDKEKVMIFESVRDPGNIGTILRNAVAFGFDRLIFTPDCADIYSQKVIRSSMGAIFKLKIDVVNDICNPIYELKNQGKRIISTTLRDNSLKLGECIIDENDVFVIGNEGHGVSQNVIAASDATLFIPMSENTESLNASIAAAILMWETFKI